MVARHPFFRIERFGSSLYGFSRIVLLTKEETLDYLSEESPRRDKYEEEMNRLWTSGDAEPSLDQLRLPCNLVLEYTRRCNLKCSYCYAGSTQRGDTMTEDLYRQVVGMLGREDVYDIHVLGGEPFIFPERLEYLIKHTVDKRITVGTNGTLVRRSFLGWLKDDRNEIEIAVGIDGHNKMTHDSCRGGFDNLVKALVLLADSGIDVTATTCITALNYRYLAEIVEFEIAHGIKRVQFIPVASEHLSRKASSELSLRGKLSDVAKAIAQIIETYGGEIVIDHNIDAPVLQKYERIEGDEILYGPCDAGIVRAVITPDGRLSSCAAVPSSSTSVPLSSSLESSFGELKTKLQSVAPNARLMPSRKLCDMFGYGRARES